MKKIFCDASGKTGVYCYVVEGVKGVRFFKKKCITSNEGEYLAVIAALKENAGDIAIYSDSQLVVNQLNRNFAIKEKRMRKLAEEVWKLSEGRSVTFTWVRRQYNKAGKVLG